MRVILILCLLLLTAATNEVRELACRAAGNMGKVGYEFQSKMTRDEFFKQVEKLTPLKRQSVTIGFLANSEEEAFSDAFANCINYKEEPAKSL